MLHRWLQMSNGLRDAPPGAILDVALRNALGTETGGIDRLQLERALKNQHRSSRSSSVVITVPQDAEPYKRQVYGVVSTFVGDESTGRKVALRELRLTTEKMSFGSRWMPSAVVGAPAEVQWQGLCQRSREWSIGNSTLPLSPVHRRRQYSASLRHRSAAEVYSRMCQQNYLVEMQRFTSFLSFDSTMDDQLPQRRISADHVRPDSPTLPFVEDMNLLSCTEQVIGQSNLVDPVETPDQLVELDESRRASTSTFVSTSSEANGDSDVSMASEAGQTSVASELSEAKDIKSGQADIRTDWTTRIRRVFRANRASKTSAGVDAVLNI